VSRSALLPLSVALLLLAVAFRALASWAPGSSGFSPIDSWFFDATATFPQVVFALAAFLLFRRRRRLRAAARGAGAPGRGAAALASGTARRAIERQQRPDRFAGDALHAAVGERREHGG
jgi:hypothetical protein